MAFAHVLGKKIYLLNPIPIKEGEKIEEALKREVKEETNLQLNQENFYGLKKFYWSPSH